MMMGTNRLGLIEDLAMRFEEASKIFAPTSSSAQTSTQSCLTLDHYHSTIQISRKPRKTRHLIHRSGIVECLDHRKPTCRPGEIYNQNYDIRNFKCTHCGMLGHFWQRCRRLLSQGYCRHCGKNGNWPVECTESGNTPNSTAAPNIFCCKCGQEGHIS